MPLYEFSCPYCEDDFEELCSMDEQLYCPKCGAKIYDKNPSYFTLKGCPTVKY